MTHPLDDPAAVNAEFLDPAPFADLLIGYCLEVEAGAGVLIRSSTLATPLLLELQRAVLQRSAWPTFDVELPGQTRTFYENARAPQLDDFDDVAMAQARKIDAVIAIQAPYERGELAGSTRRRSPGSPARGARSASAR